MYDNTYTQSVSRLIGICAATLLICLTVVAALSVFSLLSDCPSYRGIIPAVTHFRNLTRAEKITLYEALLPFILAVTFIVCFVAGMVLLRRED